MDYAASAPLAEGVAEAMAAVRDGNPSSIHAVGEEARKRLDSAREVLAKEIGAKSSEVVFTSGATESNNLALKGVVQAGGNNMEDDRVGGNGLRGCSAGKRKKIIVSAVEHASVWEPVQRLQEEGVEVGVVGVDSGGRVDLDSLRGMVDEETLLVSVQHANNEFGSIQGIAEIGKLCRSKGVLFHVDAAQTFGKLAIDVGKMGVDLLSASAHKIGGPKGVGLLFVKDGVSLNPVLAGGGQEKGLRSGTENVAGAVGFAAALKEQKKVDITKVKMLRDLLLEGLEGLGGKLVGSREGRLWNIVQVVFADKDGEEVVMRLSEKGVMAGTGSACSSRKEDGRVLKNVGLSDVEVGGVVRFSLGAGNSEVDVDFVLASVKEIFGKR